MNIEIRQKDESVSWEELTDLIHDAFQERLDQGLHFACSYFTPEEFKRVSANAIVLVAIDKDNNRLAGTSSIVICRKDEGNWAYFKNMAIHPDYKRRGVGSRLVKYRTEIARENGCQYVISDTAVGAKSSVEWHKKNGFKIFKLVSWPNTNYYSYVFRKQLVDDPKWNNPLYCKMRYYLSAMKCKLKYKANGEHTPLMKLIVKICSLI